MNILKDPMWQGLLIAVAIGIFAFWFYLTKIEQENYIAIDNPTDKTLEVNVSGKEYTLAPFQTIEIDLEPGEHTVSAKSEDSTYQERKFNYRKQVRGLINPTQNAYVVFSHYYGASTKKDSILRANTSLIDNELYYAKAASIDSVFISDFYLNVNQEYPKFLKKMDTLSTMKKIFRKEKFKKFYSENYN